jgi:hypothetical protein
MLLLLLMVIHRALSADTTTVARQVPDPPFFSDS